MRKLFWVALLLVGCNDQGLTTSSDGGPSSPNSVVQSVDAAPTSNAAPPPSQSGPEGAQCKSVCDCQMGLACRMGLCATTQRQAVYCCEATTCPMGNACQSQTGDFGQCGRAPGGMNGGPRPLDGGFGGPFMRDGGMFTRDGGMRVRDGGMGGRMRDGGGPGNGGFPVDAAAINCASISCNAPEDCLAAGCTSACNNNNCAP